MRQSSGGHEQGAGKIAGRARRSLVALCCALTCGALATPAYAGMANDGVAPDPLAGLPLTVDQTAPAAVWLREHRGAPGARAMSVLAGQATSRWFGAWQRSPRAAIRDYLIRAAGGTLDGRLEAKSGTITPISVFRLPHVEHCNVATTAADVASYKRWIDQFALGIGSSRVALILEPDGLMDTFCLPRASRLASLALIKYSGRVLGNLPHTTVYIDAGASDWGSVTQVVWALRRAGIGQSQVRGFALDVTHYRETRYQLAYGDKISRALGGKHYVVNTAQNGVVPGHAHKPRNQGGLAYWCNPSYVALGQRPTTRTGHRLADAYLWIGRPWLSDGACPMSPADHHSRYAKNAFDPDRTVPMITRAAWYESVS